MCCTKFTYTDELTKKLSYCRYCTGNKKNWNWNAGKVLACRINASQNFLKYFVSVDGARLRMEAFWHEVMAIQTLYKSPPDVYFVLNKIRYQAYTAGPITQASRLAICAIYLERKAITKEYLVNLNGLIMIKAFLSFCAS